MSKASYFPLLAASLALAVPQLALSADKTAEVDAKGEAELAKLLEGRVAGEPVRCLSDSKRSQMQIVDRTAFVFSSGDTIYVNRPDGALFLDDFDVPVFKMFGSDLCRMDRVEMRGRTSSMSGPTLTMGEFVPYRRIRDADTSGEGS